MTHEQWLPSASDQEDQLPIGEDVGRAYIDGRNAGRQYEQSRIRKELLISFHLAFGSSEEAHETRHLLAVLDRICPEEMK